MEYTIKNLDIIFGNEEFVIYDVLIKKKIKIKKKSLSYHKNKIIHNLEKILPKCILFKIDFYKFITIAYNNIITQLNIIIENNDELTKKLNLHKLVVTDNVTDSFNYYFIIWYYVRTINSICLNEKINYGTILNNLALDIYDVLCSDYKNINFYILI
jgi:hypothetical protein